MKYEYWLACLKGISPNKKILLRKRVKTAEELYYHRRNTDGGI